MTLVVGITGGIGSGKSTFSKEVIKRNLKLLDSDKEVGLIYKNPKENFLNHLRKIGLEKSIKNKVINKKYIQSIIFTDRNIKTKLETYIFKIVRKNRSIFVKKEKKRKTNIIFLDIPLLFENNLDKEFDVVVTIISSKKERLKRLQKSKKISKQTFNKIIKSQTTDKERKTRSDIIIYNNYSVGKYLKKVNIILDKIIP